MRLLRSELISIDRRKPAQQSANDNNIISVSSSCKSGDLVQIFLKVLLALLVVHQLHIAGAQVHTERLDRNVTAYL